MACFNKSVWQTPRIGVIALATLLVGLYPANAAEVPAEVVQHQRAAGIALADAKGHTLYTYDRDTDPAKSSCVEKCEETWPPLLAPENAKPHDDWTLITRRDGSLQWVYKGKPLHTYVKDDTAEAAYGDGVGKIWHVAFEPIATPPGLAVGTTLRGDVLTDSHGRTLYTRDSQKADPQCKGNCLHLWEPITAPWTAQGWGDWSAVDVGGGIRQWAYKGKPLYRYSRDAQRGDVRGERVSDQWHLASLGPPPPVPPFVTVQPSDFGPVLADAEGKTLYARFRVLERIKKETCDDACFAAHWRQVSAPAGTKPVGQWALKEEGGTLHWTFKGSPVYIYLDDARPGDTGGFRFAVGNGSEGTAWLPILQSYLIDPMT